jgi:hypothetical protein
MHGLGMVRRRWPGFFLGGAPGLGAEVTDQAFKPACAAAGLGHASGVQVSMNSNRKLVNGFRVKSFFDWAFVMLSFLVFLALEGAMVYAFFVFMNKL